METNPNLIKSSSFSINTQLIHNITLYIHAHNQLLHLQSSGILHLHLPIKLILAINHPSYLKPLHETHTHTHSFNIFDQAIVLCVEC